MTEAGTPNNNAQFLAVIDSEARAVILESIAKHYGIIDPARFIAESRCRST